MGRRGPGSRRNYRHQLVVRVDDETWNFLKAMAAITGGNKSDVARVAIERDMAALDEHTRAAIEETCAEFQQLFEEES